MSIFALNYTFFGYDRLKWKQLFMNIDYKRPTYAKNNKQSKEN